MRSTVGIMAYIDTSDGHPLMEAKLPEKTLGVLKKILHKESCCLLSP